MCATSDPRIPKGHERRGRACPPCVTASNHVAVRQSSSHICPCHSSLAPDTHAEMPPAREFMPHAVLHSFCFVFIDQGVTLIPGTPPETKPGRTHVPHFPSYLASRNQRCACGRASITATRQEDIARVMTQMRHKREEPTTIDKRNNKKQTIILEENPTCSLPHYVFSFLPNAKNTGLGGLVCLTSSHTCHPLRTCGPSRQVMTHYA